MSVNHDISEEFAVSFDMKDIYGYWNEDDPDNLKSMLLAFQALLSIGMKPKRVVFHPQGGFTLIFDTWTKAAECRDLTRDGISLLWLMK